MHTDLCVKRDRLLREWTGRSYGGREDCPHGGLLLSGVTPDQEDSTPSDRVESSPTG